MFTAVTETLVISIVNIKKIQMTCDRVSVIKYFKDFIRGPFVLFPIVRCVKIDEKL